MTTPPKPEPEILTPGIRETSRKARLNAILEALQTPKTLQAVADEVGVSYYTVRRDVLMLAKQNLTRLASSRTEEGASLWIAGSSKPMPVVYVPASSQHHPISTLSDAYYAALREGGNRTTEAALDVLEVAADLMHKVYFMSQGGQLSNSDLMPLRAKLTSARRFLNSTTSIADQMLEILTLWDVEKLLRIMEDEDFAAERMENNYQESLKLRHADKPTE